MQFDPENTVVKLCAQGMEQEMAGKPALARQLFLQAWEKAANDKEKCTAAHYVARHQETVADKLKWDQTALQLATKIGTDEIKAAYPSLYLNIAKCYEDLGDTKTAHEHYLQAQSFITYLKDDGYGKMVRAGIEAGIERVK